MSREINIKTKPQFWMEISLDLLHGAAWLGLYEFFKTLALQSRIEKGIGIVICLCFVVECILYGTGRIFRGGYRLQWPVFAEALILSLYGGSQGIETVQIYGLFLGGICIIAHFWCISLQGMQEYLQQNAGLDNVPEDNIFWGNSKIVVCLLAIPAVLFAGIILVQGDISVAAWLLSIIKNGFVQVVRGLRKIFLLFGKVSDGEKTPVQVTSQPMATRIPAVTNDDNTQGLGVIIALVAVGLVIIYIFVKMILSSDGGKETPEGQRPVFHHHGTGQDKIEKVDMEQRKLFFFRNNREQIRFYFKKRVQKFYEKKTPPNYTSGEFCCAIREAEHEEKEDVEELEQLDSLYDIARYSEKQITKQQVREIKKLCRK